MNVIPGSDSPSMVGAILNNSASPVNLVEVTIGCFDASGQPLHAYTDYVTPTEIAPGAPGSFQVGLPDSGCPRYLVGASIW